ncbi:hypothetical protein G647_07309 [Cladophialophora carrionii CBS 160.54]|uniref:Tachykinin family protein n=1 Tax=Cladophialophora carrionii CBS 160.54 TaxID=1279043 RepID=V9D2W6_9EURO|nr:uncharacterized protein G647_07309 [Cladophialophora carrionii CBS 160.54]ETI20966.1 hypothetical protein G647_07309 [Cladophialophora carrionii CBS 160.54]
MAQPRRQNTYHFVPAATNAPGGRKAVEKRARAHAAKVTHERRAAKRGAVVKWINESGKSRATGTQLVARNPPMMAQFEISPLSQLSQAKVDPFETNPHTILPNQLQSILDWAYEYVHPKVLSAASEDEASMIKISWRRVGQEWPMMFHLQVAAAVNLHRADVDLEPLPKEIDAMAQSHSERGLNMVRKELGKLKGPPSDALIMAQIMVALLTTPDQTTSFDGFRRSPLATAQNLHRYARLAIVPHLIGALLELVTKRGGIESTRDFGNSQLLQFADLMISSRLGIQPSFPWLRPSLPILKGPRYQPDHQAIAISRVIGTGFRQLDSIDLRLANILRDAGEITVALDHYQECRPNAPRLSDLINAANETHHKLLSIGVNMPPYPSKLDFLCDMCRLAGLIYSDFVLFSLPTTTQVRPRLGAQLRAAVEQFEKFEAGRSATTYYGHDVGDHNILVMWALILGGLASLNTPEKPYFVQKLREYVERVPYVSEWRAFSELMGTYLWWDYIFEEPGSGLWTEVVQSPSLHHRPSGDSLYKHSASPTSIPIHTHHRTPATELGTYGLPTPSSSEQSPQPANLQWEPIWTLPRDASLVHWVWT